MSLPRLPHSLPAHKLTFNSAHACGFTVQVRGRLTSHDWMAERLVKREVVQESFDFSRVKMSQLCGSYMLQDTDHGGCNSK